MKFDVYHSYQKVRFIFDPSSLVLHEDHDKKYPLKIVVLETFVVSV